jgi:hypothetical protein
MPDPAPSAELLRSLGRLARGLSALFWGLPAALLVCAYASQAQWLQLVGLAPALAALGLLLFGLWEMGHFQKQERPWRNALDRAKLLGLVNLGLCPFLYWSNRVPDQMFFTMAVRLFGFSGLLFLFNLNLVLQRLGAMLPDETLRHETKQFTVFNRALLLATLALAIIFLALSRLPSPPLVLVNYFVLLERGNPWSYVLLVVLPLAILVLLPLAMTMALIWKTKEVILDSVFNARN